jgi:tetratricopeptide (TPR) repeat protein
MKLIKPLTLAIALMLGTSFAMDAYAARKDKEEDVVLTFPDATREEPEAKVTDRLFKDIQKLQEAYDEAGREEEAIGIAEKILASDRAKPYDRGLALLLAGGAAASLGDDDRAISYISRAIEENALPNENHFNAMHSLGGIYFNAERWTDAQKIFKRLIEETRTTDPEYWKLYGASYYNADQFAESIEPLKKAIELDTTGEKSSDAMQLLMGAYNELNREADALALAESMLAKNPDDKRMLMNVVTLYSNLDQQEKAVGLLDGARQRGLITTADDYKRLYATYFQIDREAEAAKVIEEGLAKQILPADGETYTNLAQAHYFSDNVPAAIAAAQKGAPLASDGQLALFLAQVLNQEDRNPESIAAARQALAKGLKKPGDAWMVIARAEYYSDNIAGAKAAFQEAAKDPSTRSQAQEELAKLNQ